jgi:hypothetical protein
MRVITVLAMMTVTWIGLLDNSALCQEDSDVPASLSSQALEALVASVAFYSDRTIEQILAASQYPDAIHQAVKTGGQPPADAEWPPSVKALLTQPEILLQLQENPVSTARLALAAKTQLAEVWAAIDRVRTNYQEAVANGEADGTATESVGTEGIAYPSAAFIAGYWTAQVLDEIRVWHHSYVVTTTTANSVHVTTGPAGATGNGAGVVTQTSIGNSAHISAAAAGTVTTPAGTTIAGQGTATGTATQTESGAAYHHQAQGAVVSEAGTFAAGSHSASGGYHVNADGSVDFGRTSHSSTNSSYGSTDISHSGSGSFTGQGSGDYAGSTDIDSSHGDASVTTNIADGQAATTVTTSDGTQTHTWGTASTDNSSRERQRETASATERTTASQLDSLLPSSHFSSPTAKTPFSFRRPSSGLESLRPPTTRGTTTPMPPRDRSSSILQTPVSRSGASAASSYRRPTSLPSPQLRTGPVPAPTSNRGRPAPSRSRRGRR